MLFRFVCSTNSLLLDIGSRPWHWSVVFYCHADIFSVSSVFTLIHGHREFPGGMDGMTVSMLSPDHLITALLLIVNELCRRFRVPLSSASSVPLRTPPDLENPSMSPIPERGSCGAKCHWCDLPYGCANPDHPWHSCYTHRHWRNGKFHGWIIIGTACWGLTGHEFSDLTAIAIQAEVWSVTEWTSTSRSSPGVSIPSVCIASGGNERYSVLRTVFSSATSRFRAGRRCNRILNCLSLKDVWVIQIQYQLILCLTGLFQRYCILPDVNKGLLAECFFPVLYRCSVRCALICYHRWAHYPEFGKRRVWCSSKVCTWTEFWTM